MKQDNIKPESVKRWVEDDDQPDDAEVVKLEEGQSIEGLLLERKESETFGFIYKLQVKDKELPQIICGSTILNKKMMNKEIGKEVRIERVKDFKTLKGRMAHDFKVYHVEEDQGA